MTEEPSNRHGRDQRLTAVSSAPPQRELVDCTSDLRHTRVRTTEEAEKHQADNQASPLEGTRRSTKECQQSPTTAGERRWAPKDHIDLQSSRCRVCNRTTRRRRCNCGHQEATFADRMHGIEHAHSVPPRGGAGLCCDHCEVKGSDRAGKAATAKSEDRTATAATRERSATTHICAQKDRRDGT